MLSILKLALGWLTGGTLDRIPASVDHNISNDTTREAVKADLVADYMKAQVAILTGRGWWFLLCSSSPPGSGLRLFASTACFGAGLRIPQEWTIAALPTLSTNGWGNRRVPLHRKAGGELIARLRK